MKNSILNILENTKDKDFLNYLIEGKANEKQVINALWDYVLNNKEHSLFYVLGWQGGHIHGIIKEVLKRQKTKDVIK